jgi:2,4-dienoyl-CoA reductase-like NADH-dependent reductase (Old Yellow Enzyme family)/thioredoxin reductase
MNEYPNLFSPLKVGNVWFRNRILASATGHLDMDQTGVLSEGALLYYERKAVGGAAAVVVGECNIDPKNGSRGGATIDLSNFGHLRFLNKLSDYIARHGAAPSAELQHAGRYGAAGLGPSEGEVDGHPCVAMTEEQIEQTIQAYANAAGFARMAGFQMVTIHGGHGWLPQQFFSRFYNTRRDKWGGSLENRSRFAVAICDAIHQKCGPAFPVEIRISATEFEDGYGVEEGIEYAQALDGHADIIHVSVAVHGSLSSDHWLRFTPSMFLADGENVKYAAEIKKHIKSSRIATVGALTDPAMMEEILASGKADFVAIARGLLADPDLPNKARSGRTDEIRKCIRCMSCWSNLMGGQIYCALNPETSREQEFKVALKPAKRQKVLVAGGGIAGMQAALTAAENGHEVTLCEKSDHLGGGISCEKGVPFKIHVEEYLALQERLIRRAPIDLRLNTGVSAELVEALRPDVLVAALGARPITPAIPGIEGVNVFPAEAVYRNPEHAGARTVIIGAGLVGTELAIYLSMLGREVEILEMAPQMNSEGNMLQGMIIAGQLRERNIPLRCAVRVVSITPEGALYEGPEGPGLAKADTVVYATGQKPLIEEALVLGRLVPDFRMAGDVLGPRNIMGAVKTAHTIARDIGRH